jgi:UDP-N-acetylglucosamine:LPS N-acetylglucosamine transferase
VTLEPPIRVLLVYSRVGGGHLSAARALAAELEATGQARTRLVDIYAECGRFPVSRFPAGYAWLSRSHPRLWWMVYRASEGRIDPQRGLRPFLRSRVRRLLDAERPDLIVSVLPAVNGMLARMRVRLEVVLTDWHSVHKLWVARGVAHYTAPTDSARVDCIRFGAPPSAVEAVGIPVRRDFAVRTPRVAAGERFRILAMVGAEGSPHALRNLAELAQLELDAELIVVCGRNAALRSRVEHLAARMPVRALGYVDDIAGLMRSADVLVTKAGGMTLAEAFCCGVPVVVHDVLPGQESGNLEYVLSKRAVAYAPHGPALARVVAELYADPGRRKGLAARGATLARPDAAQRIARGLLERLDAARAELGRDGRAE